MQQLRKATAIHVSLVTMVWNTVLSIFKLFAGIYAKSSAMISDAVHSISDVLSTIVVIIGVNLANKEADKEHPYGHERIECVAALILSIFLFITGGIIGYVGIIKIVSGNYVNNFPGILALVAAIISIVVKEIMYWYTRVAAKKINSGALMADAWHHRSDALSSIGSFIGIFGSRLGFPILDSLASIIVCIFIIKASINIFIDSINKMMDKACDENLVKTIQKTILMQDGVIGIDKINTRLFGNRIYIDVEIKADANLSLYQSHMVAHKVHDSIEATFVDVKHCMVHVNPAINN